MTGTAQLGRTLILIGVFIVILGLSLVVMGKLTGGRGLPGDILIRRPHFTFVFPLATSVLLSLLLTGVLWLIGTWLRR